MNGMNILFGVLISAIGAAVCMWIESLIEKRKKASLKAKAPHKSSRR